MIGALQRSGEYGTCHIGQFAEILARAGRVRSGGLFFGGSGKLFGGVSHVADDTTCKGRAPIVSAYGSAESVASSSGITSGRFARVQHRRGILQRGLFIGRHRRRARCGFVAATRSA